MIIETYICDKCGKAIQIDLHEGMYFISHESLSGYGMPSDYRIPRKIGFCRDCFDNHIAPLVTPLKIRE